MIHVSHLYKIMSFHETKYIKCEIKKKLKEQPGTGPNMKIPPKKGSMIGSEVSKMVERKPLTYFPCTETKIQQ